VWTGLHAKLYVELSSWGDRRHTCLHFVSIVLPLHYVELIGKLCDRTWRIRNQFLCKKNSRWNSRTPSFIVVPI